MFYIKKHAIQRYKQRIEDIQDESTIQEKILEIVLFHITKVENKKRNQKAYIKGGDVAITKISGNEKDETIVTILTTSYKNCWWNKEGK